MSDRSVPPPIPDEAVIALAKANKVISDSRWAGKDDWDLDDYGNRVVVREGLTEQDRAHWIGVYREDLERAVPALYKHWGERLVERIRDEGEFADGVADYVADLLGLDGEETR